MQSHGVTKIVYYDPVDDWLHTRLRNACLQASIQTECLESPLFLCSNLTLSNTFDTKLRKVNQTSFYIKQRKALNILLNDDHTPIGGKWTFDTDNRKKYPKIKSRRVFNIQKIALTILKQLNMLSHISQLT